MNEYIINSIKKFKIKNDVNSDVFIHEYYTYTYKKVKYIDIYVYKKNKNIGCININNSYPIFINFIDEYKHRDLITLQKPPQCLGMTLHSICTTDHKNCIIQYL